MKKLITLLLTLTMIASLFVLPSAAITETEAAALKYTVVAQASNGYSFTGDDVLFYGKYCMRGMAISQDGKYAFGGFLNPGGSSAIEMFDLSTGKVIAGYQYIQPENNTASYPKGLATDDRGYLYAALAYNKNYGRADLAVLNYSDGSLNQLSYTNIVTTTSETKTGVNGITVEQINGSYYAYVVVNYDVDYLARFNVTDPANPVLDSSFGEGGLIDLQKEPYNSGDPTKFEACYLDVDTDGTIYIACKDASSKMVYVLSSDGSMILGTIPFETTAYGVAVWDNYLFVTSQNTGKITICDKSLMSIITTVEITTDNTVLPIDRDDILINGGVNSLCNVTVVNDILFLGDQAANQSGLDQIFAVGLTTEAAAVVDTYAKGIYERLATLYPEKTEAPDTSETPVVTDEPTDATDVTDEPTDAPEATDAPTDAPVATDAPSAGTDAPAPEKTGCGGMIAGAVAVVALLGTAIVFKKRD